MAEPALRDRHRLVRYHRVGYGGSDRVAGPVSIEQQAAQCQALLEPALMPVPSRAAWVQAVAVPAVACYQAGDRAEAVDIWMRGVAGPGWRRVLDDALPGAFDQAVADAGTFFDSHLVSPVWGERQALLEAWLGDVEPFVLAGATHMLHLQRPLAMAEALAGFFARHEWTRPRC